MSVVCKLMQSFVSSHIGSINGIMFTIWLYVATQTELSVHFIGF